MTISELMECMIEYTAKDSLVVNHDVNHFMKVWGFAKTIGELEQLDERTQYIVEASALLHDIACPLCRRKYGNTNGKYQETEGKILAAELLAKTDIPEDVQERIVYIVSHHHSPLEVDGIDYQIMLEADYLVNADESAYSKENIVNTRDKMFKTNTGIRLLNEIYL